MSEKPERNLALELVRVTEAAALAAGRFMGRGDKDGGDQAAVDAMRLVLNSVEMDGVIVIGEGEKDEAPMLYNGEKLGAGISPEVDIAVDPIDGTRLLALGRANSLSTVALADRGTMFNPGPIVYMDKIAVGPEGKGAIVLGHPHAGMDLEPRVGPLEHPLGLVFVQETPEHEEPRHRAAERLGQGGGVVARPPRPAHEGPVGPEAAVRDQSDHRRFKIAQRSGGLAAGKSRWSDFGLEFFAAQFGEQHVDGALGRRLGG